MTEIGAMFEKEKEEAVREAVKEAVILAEAKGLVESVHQNALNGNLSLEEACRLRGITVTAYNVARQYVKEHTEE